MSKSADKALKIARAGSGSTSHVNASNRSRQFSESEHPRSPDGKFYITPGDVHHMLKTGGKDLFVRWSKGPTYDMKPGARSKDYQTGEIHQGLSSKRLEQGDHPGDLANTISEYSYVSTDPSTEAHVYSGKKVGTDSDGAPSIIPDKYMGSIDNDFSKHIAKHGTEILRAKHNVESFNRALNNGTKEKDSIRRTWEDHLSKAKERVASLSNIPEHRQTESWFNRSLGKNTYDAPAARAAGGAVISHSGPINSSVAGRTDHLPLHVDSGSYVIPADIVSAYGEGNTSAGFKVMKRLFQGVPYDGSGGPYGKGSRTYDTEGGPYGQSDSPYNEEIQNRAKGGPSSGKVPVVVAGGEYSIPPHVVMQIGHGDMDRGHRVLDQFILRSRKELVDTLKKLPGPARG